MDRQRWRPNFVLIERLFYAKVTSVKHIIAILFILLDIIVFAGVSWATGDFSPSPTATPKAAPTVETGVATPTLPPPGGFFPDIERLP